MAVAPDLAEAAQTSSPRAKVWLRLLVAMLWIPWARDGVRLLVQGFQWTGNPVPTCATEMHILDGTACVAAGSALYPRMDDLHLAYHLYNPLTYLPSGLMGRWCGWDLPTLLQAGRLLSWCAAIGILVLLAWWVWQQTKEISLALLTPVMLLYFHSSTLTDFFRNRPETLAILLSLIGWMIVQWRPRGWILWSSLACVAAMSLKPTFVAAPLAIGLQLFMQRDTRALVAGMLTSFVLGGIVIAASYAWLGNGYFQHTVEAMQSNPWQPWRRSWFFYRALVELHWGWLLPACLVSLVALWRDRRDWPLLNYLGICLVVTTLAHGKVGSDLNYHGELSVLMVLATLVGMGRWWSLSPKRAAVPLICLLIGTWGAVAQFGWSWNELSMNRLIPRPYNVRTIALPPADSYVKRYQPYQGHALILDDELAVLVGGPVAYDWYALRLLFQSEVRSFAALEDAIRQQQFAVLVLSPVDPLDEYSARLRDTALAHGYRLTLHDQRVREYARPGTALETQVMEEVHE